MSRLAYVCADPGIPVFGTKGASVHVQEVVRGYRAAGWDVTVHCTRRGDVVPPDLRDLPVVEHPVGKGPTALRERLVAEASARIADAVVDEGADLVHERYALFSTAGAEASARIGCALLVEVNAPLVEEQGRHRELVDVQTAWTATRRTFDAATRLACVSEPVAGWTRALVGDASGVCVVPNGVDTERVRPAPRQPDVFTVGFVGTLKPWHGVEVLVEAFARAAEPDWRLLLCGDGPARPDLERLAARRGVPMELTGALPPTDVPHQLHRMSVAVAPYPPGEDHYFSPLKVYEYLAAGLPVVASRIGQTAAVIRHGENGLLVPPGDADALGAALRRLHADMPLRHDLARCARADAVRDHGWDGVVRRLLDSVAVSVA